MANKKSALAEAKELLAAVKNKAIDFKSDYQSFSNNLSNKASQAKTNFTKFVSDSSRSLPSYSNGTLSVPVGGGKRIAITKKQHTPEENKTFFNSLPETISSQMRQTGDRLADSASKIPSFKIGMDTPTFLGLGPTVHAPTVNPSNLIRVMSRGVANTVEGLGSGARDLIQSGVGFYKNPWDLKNYTQAVRGVGKIGFQALPVTTAMNLLASSKDTGVLPRVGAGFLRGGTGEDSLAPNVQENRIKLGPVEFDPAMVGGQMFGFIRNPVNKKLFELTQTYLPSSGKNIKTWLATTGIRGGIENLILTLPDMPKGTAEEKAKYLTENFAIGAGTEIAAQGVTAGVKKAVSKEFLSKVFDELSQLKTNMLNKIEEPSINLKDLGVRSPEEALAEVMTRTEVPAGVAPKVSPEKTIEDIGITSPGDKSISEQIKGIGHDLGVIRASLKSAKDPGIKETLKNEEKFLRQQYTQLKNMASGEGFTAEGQAAMAAAPEKGKVKYNKPRGQEANDSIFQAFKDWVNSRRASRVEGLMKGKEFQNLDSEGMDAILRFQKGAKEGLEKVQEYFNAKYADLKKAGLDFGFRENYLPQLWDNTPQEIEKVFPKKLSTKPGFTMERIIESYQEGIAKGLKPRFGKMSELVRWYESTANRSLADKSFFEALIKDKFILPSGKQMPGWVELRNLPSIKGKGGYEGKYFAPQNLADKINNYLDTPALGSQSQRIIAGIASFTSAAKNRMLSFGIPGTGINAHGFNILARSYLERGPVGALETAYYMVNPNAAGKAVDFYMAQAPDAVKSGLTFSTHEYDNAIDNPEIRSLLGQKWDDLFEKPLFEKVISAKKMEGWSRLWKEYAKKMPEKQAKAEAAKFMNTLYGGINWEELGRSRDVQNWLRIGILAPDWLETNLRLGKGMVTSLFNIKNPAGKAYRRAMTYLVAGYVALNVVNKMTSGHYMVQNDTGHTFEVEAGYTEDGQKRYIRPFGTAVDFARLPVDIAVGALQGDYSVASRTVRNRTSSLVSPIVSLLTNTNWKGQRIMGKDQYGNPIPPAQQAAGVVSELGTVIGVPAVLREALDYGTGKQGLEPFITQGLELPFRYSGGAYSKTQKELTELARQAGYKGKDLYDLNKATSGESFSENQMGLIGQSKDPIQVVRNLLKIKENKAKAKKSGEGSSAVDGGEKWYILDGDSVKAIDKVWNPPTLELTGNETIDKKLKSKYKSEITGRINDVITLLQNGMISEEEAAAEVDKLQGTYDSMAAPKKPKKVSLKLPKLSAPPKLKLTIKKGEAPKKISLKSSKVKMPARLSQTYESNYKAPRISVRPSTGLIRSGMPLGLGGVGRA